MLTTQIEYHSTDLQRNFVLRTFILVTRKRDAYYLMFHIKGVFESANLSFKLQKHTEMNEAKIHQGKKNRSVMTETEVYFGDRPTSVRNMRR